KLDPRDSGQLRVQLVNKPSRWIAALHPRPVGPQGAEPERSLGRGWQAPPAGSLWALPQRHRPSRPTAARLSRKQAQRPAAEPDGVWHRRRAGRKPAGARSRVARSEAFASAFAEESKAALREILREELPTS